MFEKGFIELSDLYLAYKKAKSDAFFESIHCDAWAYARYEKKLPYNLKVLLKKIRSGMWAQDVHTIGTYSYAPKSLREGEGWRVDGHHFSTLDPCKDWERGFRASGNLATAEFRQIIKASVDYQVINALWILKVGHIYEDILDEELSYGNRLRRRNPKWWQRERNGEINTDSLGLFKPYFSAYQAWRENGLKAIRSALDGESYLVAATMDARRFYHNVSPTFLLKKGFLESFALELTPDQKKFTAALIESIQIWYLNSPDSDIRKEGALPVGLSSSKVIANVALAGFDQLITQRVKPLYYGRYVDDIFLVTDRASSVQSSSEFFEWLSGEVGDGLHIDTTKDGERVTRFTADYLSDSDVIFAQDKQKVFVLHGKHGLDLVEQIEQQIRDKSSEYRLLPDLPDTANEMLSRALVASPDANLEADALRKAEAVSVRRLGFAMLLGDVEAYARDLDPKDWRPIRITFYEMTLRHVITPKGIFDYFSYIVRVVGLMSACRDFRELMTLLEQFNSVLKLIQESCGLEDSLKFKICKNLYARCFFQAAMQASTIRGFRWSNGFIGALKTIKQISHITTPRISAYELRKVSLDLLMADLGRRSYKEYWISSATKYPYASPPVPRDRSVQRELRLAGVRSFRKLVAKELGSPHWPAITFATRPLTVQEITSVAPKVLDEHVRLERAIFSLRGARTERWKAPHYVDKQPGDERPILYVPAKSKEEVRVALVSYLVLEEDWKSALSGRPNRSLERYRRFSRLVNEILRSAGKIDYVVFPEASVPRRWAFSVASKLAKAEISFIAGLENSNSKGFFRNDALVSLSSRWPGYPSSLVYVQPKLLPARSEERALKKFRRKMYKPTVRAGRPIYQHGSHYFGVTICSDLTNISNRLHFQGQIDSLFVLEWNRDTDSFSSLVEASAQDLHAYVVQVNNRKYGDSRVRVPAKMSFERDLVRVKGGDEDYFVISPLQIGTLKKFHSGRGAKSVPPFKPLPIGFDLAESRKSHLSDPKSRRVTKKR